MAALLHRLFCIPGAGLQLGDHLLDFAGRGLSLDGEGADLVGYYREAATRFASPGRFDGGIECQQVGLVGDVVDHIEDAVDIAAVADQRTDHALGGGQLAVHARHGGHGFGHAVVAALEQVGGLVQQAGGFAGAL